MEDLGVDLGHLDPYVSDEVVCQRGEFARPMSVASRTS
jgi:hypothetical protein